MTQFPDSLSPVRRPRVVIAGASGFIGGYLAKHLASSCDVIGLSRHHNAGADSTENDPVAGRKQITWRQCDLFSAVDTETALQECDIAIYLIHSMMPSARLAQGSFEDFDVVIADNFGRAARACGVKRIIYLGGIIPPGELSRHLESRLEVEKVLAEFGVPLIALRAGMVIGQNGSSYDMMRKLVLRLPAMICPKWTATKSSPIAVENVVAAIAGVVKDGELKPGSYDLGGSETVTYLEMMQILASMLGKHRIMIPVFIFSPKLSCLWVRLVTGAPRELVGPLVESLRHEMVPRDQYILDRYDIAPMSFRSAIAKSIAEPKPLASALNPKNGPKSALRSSTVYSFQRMPLPHGKSAYWAADQYAKWLINFFRPLLCIQRSSDGVLVLKIRFLIEALEIVLLRLAYDAARSTPDRDIFAITGGVLVDTKASKIGVFEFREVLSGTSLIVAIFDYAPALPWWIYERTQAVIHLIVMHAFQKHMENISQHKI